MTPIFTATLAGIVAALLSGFLLGWLHHQLKPNHLSKVGAYTIGSSVCLLFSILAVFVTDYTSTLTAWGVVVILGLVWGISGAAVVLAYWGDGRASNKRLGQ